MLIDCDWLRQWYSRIAVGQQVYPMTFLSRDEGKLKRISLLKDGGKRTWFDAG
jgi:hypothetical protein